MSGSFDTLDVSSFAGGDSLSWDQRARTELEQHPVRDGAIFGIVGAGAFWLMGALGRAFKSRSMPPAPANLQPIKKMIDDEKKRRP
jgi:hypothetical protein